MDVRQAITVRYLGPTNHHGSRYKATAEAGSLTVECDDALNGEENAWAAGVALAKKWGWEKYNDYVIGGLHGGGYVLVAIEKKERA
jgi:hypothetical protein